MAARTRSREGKTSTTPSLDGGLPGSPAAELAVGRGLRVRPRRPMRALVGVLVVVAAVVAVLAIYTKVGDRREVLMLSRAVLAGEQLEADDVQVVSIGSDEDFAAVNAAELGSVVGQYAKVRLEAGTLLVAVSLQAERLVDPTRVLASVTVPIGRVPVGLREQSRVWLVVPVDDGTAVGIDAVPLLAEATVVDVPGNLAELIGSDESGRGVVSISVEIEPRFGGVVGLAPTVGVLLIDPNAPLVLPTADELLAVVAEPAASGGESESSEPAATSTTAPAAAVSPSPSTPGTGG